MMVYEKRSDLVLIVVFWSCDKDFQKCFIHRIITIVYIEVKKAEYLIINICKSGVYKIWKNLNI